MDLWLFRLTLEASDSFVSSAPSHLFRVIAALENSADARIWPFRCWQLDSLTTVYPARQTPFSVLGFSGSSVHNSYALSPSKDTSKLKIHLRPTNSDSMSQSLQTTDFRSPCPLPRSATTDDSSMSSEDSLEPSMTRVPISNVARAASFEHHRGHWRPSSALPSDSAPALTSTITPTSTVTYVSSTSTPTLLTTLPPENNVSISTTGSALNYQSTSTRTVPVILGVVLGVAAMVALGVIILRFHARKRSKHPSNALSSDFKMSQGRRDSDLTVAIPQVNSAMLGRRITQSYGVSSTPTPERVTSCICISKPGEFSPSSGRHLSDPFADSHQDMVSSRMSAPSVDSLSITMVFAPSDNSHTQEGGEDVEKSMDGSASSLELRFVPPLVFSDDSPTRSLHLSPTGHYEGISPTSSPTENGFWNEERQSRTFATASPPPRPYCLGAESARMRLHELLMEARRPWTGEEIVS